MKLKLAAPRPVSARVRAGRGSLGPAGVNEMPGDPKECLAQARRCSELAAAAKEPGPRQGAWHQERQADRLSCDPGAHADRNPSIIHDPQHWRQRAEEARAIADQLNNPQSKEAMLRIAKDYERLAARAEQRMKDKAPE
jgi:hypothetical protein